MRHSNISKSFLAAAAAFSAFAVAGRAVADGADTLVEEFVGPEDLIVSGSVNAGVSVTDNRDRIDEARERRQFAELYPAGAKNGAKPRTKEKQTEFHVGPRISLERNVTGRIAMRISYSPVFTWWDGVREGSDEFRLNHKFDAKIDYEPSPRTRLGLSDGLWWSGQRDIYYGDDYEWTADRENDLVNDDYFVNTGTLWLRRDLGDFDWAKATGTYRVKRYDDDTRARYSDEDELTGRLDWMHVLSRRLSLGLYAKYTSWDRRSESVEGDLVAIGQARGAKSPELKVGVDYLQTGVQGTYDFSGHNDHLFYASTGWSKYWYEADDIDDRDEWGQTKVELRLFQQRDTQIIFGASYETVSAESYPFSTQEDKIGYVTVKQYLCKDRRLTASGTVEMRRRTYDLDDDISDKAKNAGYREKLVKQLGGKTEYDRDTFYVRLALDYKFTKYFSAGCNYTFHDVDPDIGMGYKENLFGVNGSLKFF